MTYSETIEYLYGLEASRGWDLKLERVHAALAALGRPERRFPSVLIAGTNGKGTTSALLHAVLCAAGRRTGIYTSPHLVRFTERIRVGQGEISEDAVVRGVERIRAVAPPERTGLTFFEVGTLLAFLHFAESEVEVAVLEVGLGGRLDATNVVDPVCSAITSIGFDHQAYLGDTLAEIAREKAGVMRRGRPTVVGPRLPDEARDAVAAAGCRLGTELVWTRADPGDVPAVGIPGRSVRDDAAVATAVLDCLAAACPGLAVGAADRARGFRTVRWPGRLEVLAGAPPLIVDGAHNLESMQSLCDELPALAGGPVSVVFGALGDKPWRELAAMIGPQARRVAVISVQQRRGVPAPELATAFPSGLPLRIGGTPYSEARRFAREDPATPIVATGSLFLVGALFAELLGVAGRESVFDPSLAEAWA